MKIYRRTKGKWKNFAWAILIHTQPKLLLLCYRFVSRKTGELRIILGWICTVDWEISGALSSRVLQTLDLVIWLPESNLDRNSS